MDQTALLSLIADLFAVITALSGYPEPAEVPPVHVVSVTEIQRMICEGPCQVKAFYLPRKGVFINDEIDLRRDAVARSVLLHELVHHVQHVSGKFESVPNRCDRWYTQEREAYRIQNLYLRQNGEPRRFLIDSLPRMCGDAQSTGGN